tara:strand:+ start:329 stop:685 length:357 start_codon:yes stop_codon:yes gene_type:complete
MNITPTNNEQTFIAAYFEAAYFTDAEWDGGDDIEDSELSAGFLRRGTIDCLAFYAANSFLFKTHISQAGNNFWLTRNGHGAGFWDREDIYGVFEAQQLTTNAEAFNAIDAEFIDQLER